MSISPYQCANIDQFHQVAGYAALYSNLLSRNRSELEDEDAKLAWATSVRTRCKRNPDKEWIEKWISNALTYKQGQTSPQATTGRPPSVGADPFALFIDTSWYLLENKETEAIEIYSIFRSGLNLPSLPNGFKFSDIVLEFIDFPANGFMTPLGKFDVIENHSFPNNTASLSDTKSIPIKYLDRNRSLSPLTDLDELDECESTTNSLNNKRRGRSLRSKKPKADALQRGFTKRNKKGTSPVNHLITEGLSSKREMPSFLVQGGSAGSTLLANDLLTKDSGIYVQLAKEAEIPLLSQAKRKLASGAYNPDSECEPPQKRRSISPIDVTSKSNPSVQAISGTLLPEMTSLNQQQMASVPKSSSSSIPEPVTMAPSLITSEASINMVAELSGNMKRKKGRQSAVSFISQSDVKSLSGPGSSMENIHGLYYRSMAERRPSRSAAHKALGRIHEQYSIDLHDPLKDVKISNDSITFNGAFNERGEMGMDGPLRPPEQNEEVVIDTNSPFNTTLEPTNREGEVNSEPLKAPKPSVKKNGKAKRKRRGKKKGKGKGKNVEIKGEITAVIRTKPPNKVEHGGSWKSRTTIPSFTSDTNPNTSDSTTGVSSLTAVACSSSSTALLSTPTTPEYAKESSMLASLYFDQRESSEKQNDEFTIDLLTPDQMPRSVSPSQYQYDHQAGSHYTSNIDVPPIEVPPPWALPHDETNYSNGSRISGSNDTHSWRVPKSQTVDFPPLLGESLCPDIRLQKPELPNQPPVWAHSRQELCESLSYFRAYQGGVYTHKRRAEGYLLDGYPARGGHSAMDRLTGRTSLVEDQASDSASCAALISSWKASQPIAVVAGSGYKLFPFSLGEKNYVVLGYYHILDAWEEPEPSTSNPRGYCVRWKFLFRWIEAQGSPWWLEENTSKRPKIPDTPLPSRTCTSCNESSRHIFRYGWVCTHSRCRAFFQLLDKSNVTNEGYNLDFLVPREDPSSLKGITLDIRPQPPVRPIILADNTEKPQLATSRHFWKGFWCEKCGKLSCSTLVERIIPVRILQLCKTSIWLILPEVELNKYQSVTEALDYIRTRATLALNYNPDFNEVLSAAYMEEQKMEYHSDGEKDLGPIVASLSLGSPAIMKFRPVPSKWMPTDGQMKEGRKTPPVIIELTLRHGDALVMEGAEIQEYYQHAVHPCGFRIAATARRVNIT
ncbi:hypothetical protein Clacol_000578 [Clathrus columnatus]|uniref:Fe2OG dioxygenase domain-containing protein n=1 Tax=Clathrus columnatus TaxID=1419009 RepID=A0AAV4ZZ34_9AGAM|nr:hypothetical protein Clacol_000578 [Clathrus columnatus]